LKKASNVDEYIAVAAEPARTTLNTIRATIRAAAPKEATEVISYGMPAFRYKEVLIWYAAFADHCSLFPKASVIEKFSEELAGYSISKGTIRFPVDRPPSKALITKMVRARVAEVEAKKKR
jgi:uncharacterized protein YdhG (YjbR/CyaY superfamily)